MRYDEITTHDVTHGRSRKSRRSRRWCIANVQVGEAANQSRKQFRRYCRGRGREHDSTLILRRARCARVRTREVAIFPSRLTHVHTYFAGASQAIIHDEVSSSRAQRVTVRERGERSTRHGNPEERIRDAVSRDAPAASGNKRPACVTAAEQPSPASCRDSR